MLFDIIRHTFPRKLRFCRQCQILHAQLFTLVKRYKHKRFIPRSELEDIADSFVAMPFPRLMANPLVRKLLLVRLVNGVRVFYDKPAWLFTHAVQEEHARLRTWLDRQVEVKGPSTAAAAAAAVPSRGAAVSQPHRGATTRAAATTAAAAAQRPTRGKSGGPTSATTSSMSPSSIGSARPAWSSLGLSRAELAETEAGGVGAPSASAGGSTAAAPTASGGEGAGRGSDPVVVSAAAGPSGALATRRAALIEREKFEKEFMAHFYIASMYHRMMLLGMFLSVLLAFIVWLNLYFDTVVFWALRYFWRFDRAAIIDWFADVVLMEHLRVSVHERYVSKIPPPTLTNEAGDKFYVNVVEFVSPDESKRVTFIPCPSFAEPRFYSAIGAIIRSCEGLLLEEVPLHSISMLPPSFFFPLREPTFPALGMAHRYYDILRTTEEPPKFFGAGSRAALWFSVIQGLAPLPLRFVYSPYLLNGSIDETRVAWGRLKEALDIENSDELAAREEAGIRHSATEVGLAVRTLAVPWNVRHIVSLEASLLRMGWRPRTTHKVLWMSRDLPGSRFCEYFGMHDDGGGGDVASGN